VLVPGGAGPAGATLVRFVLVEIPLAPDDRGSDDEVHSQRNRAVKATAASPRHRSRRPCGGVPPDDDTARLEEAKRGISNRDLVTVAQPAPPHDMPVDARAIPRGTVDEQPASAPLLQAEVLARDGDVGDDDGVP